eukprot:jgi/Tetstr1/438999/TSEL_027491.t1
MRVTDRHLRTRRHARAAIFAGFADPKHSDEGIKQCFVWLVRVPWRVLRAAKRDSPLPESPYARSQTAGAWFWARRGR